jgi:phage terminase small subunit
MKYMATKDPRRAKYADARVRGNSRRESAIVAGYGTGGLSELERGKEIQAEIKRIRDELAKNANVSKEDVVAGLLQAADMAQITADVPSMIAAWRELGRLLGHYAPEVKKVEKGLSKGDLLKAMDELTDEELQRIAQGRVIEGEFKRLPEPTDVSEVPAD